MSKKKPASKKKAPAAPLALVDSNKPVDLATLDGAQISNGWKFDAKDLGARARAMLEHVEQLKTEHAQKAVLAGVYLCQVRVSLGYGPFVAWLKEHFCNGCKSPVSLRTAYNHIALAEKFSRSAKVMMPELVASDQLTLDLQAPKGAGQQLLAKLVKFVGHLGLTDLYRRHGILKKGGKRTAAAPAAGDDTPPPPASMSPEALAYQQMVDAVNDASKALLDDVRWSLLRPEAAAKVDPLVKKLASDFHNRLLQARHEASAAGR